MSRPAGWTLDRRKVGVVQALSVAAGGVILMWLTVAVTLAMTAANVRPDVVLAFWPHAAAAKIAMARGLIAGSPEAEQQNRAIALAGDALNREPVSAAAASTLGAAVGLRGDNGRAERAFTYAERLSRRDLQAQLWLIERSVQRGDITGALRHYDIALRTSSGASALLLPVLVSASDSAAVRGPLIALLRRRPSWRMAYFEALLLRPPGSLALADQIAHSGLNPADPAEQAILSHGLDRLLEKQQYRLAAAVLPRTAEGEGLRNGGFERAPMLLPFDWWLSEETDLLAYREPGRLGEGAYVLHISSDNRGGPVARQLVTLPRGRFVLEGMAGSGGDATAAPSIAITCAGAREPIGRSVLTAAPDGAPRRFAIAFTVPDRDCVAQWITVDTPPVGSVSAWIDALRLHTAAAGKS